MEKINNWYVYLVECSDGTLYCGATNNLEKRINDHNQGKGAKYTKNRLPVTLEGFRNGLTKSEALKLEHYIKKLPKNKKIEFLVFNSVNIFGDLNK